MPARLGRWATSTRSGSRVAVCSMMRSAAPCNRAGPPGDRRHADTPFGQVALDAAVLTVGIEEVGLVPAFLVGAVVGGEQNQRVLVDVEFLNSTAEDAVTLAIGLEDPFDPQFHFGEIIQPGLSRAEIEERVYQAINVLNAEVAGPDGD